MTFYFLFPARFFSQWWPLCGTPPTPQPGSPVNPPGQYTNQIQNPPECPDRCKRFVATWRYTARNLITGAKATVERQAQSDHSYEQARAMARCLAKREAEMEVQ